ncbi:MAG TPA: PIG-L family deacetylase, partial [Bryobacteraceae bacterium]|nr:PIG-L family deacetylase [Bryobacteraceae bacterium]
MKRLLLLLLILSAAGSGLNAQKNLAGAPGIQQALARLNTVGNVLMIAAHPDDENTALLTQFARGRHLRTGYLSLTRGEGGQNLIGSEQGEMLGLLRTQELLAARRIDGAEQFFTRAIDFGFSKTAEETLEKWGRERVLGDVVWVIRRFQPDVIVLRFSGTPRDGHGQHQSSAILAKEAFAAAADPARFPEQLKYVQPWQAKRMLHNLPGFTRQMEEEAAKTPGRIEVEAGDFDPMLGYSYMEIATQSRSMHRSQGMGGAPRRGPNKNHLVTIAGEPASVDLFQGIDTTWNRIPGGAKVAEVLGQAVQKFDANHPEKTVPLLIQARPLIAGMGDSRAVQKLNEVDELIVMCAGLWLDASAERSVVVPGETAKISITALNRSRLTVRLKEVKLEGARGVPAPAGQSHTLPYNQPFTATLPWAIPASQPYSQPYWMRDPAAGNLYSVADQRLLGTPENPPVLQARFRLAVEDRDIQVTRPVWNRYVDRAQGELTRPLVVAPPVALRLAERALIFPAATAKPVEIEVTANAAAKGTVRLEAPAGWVVEPSSRAFDLSEAGQLIALTFRITPPAAESRGELRAIASVGDQVISSGMRIFDYSHIPPQTVFPPAQAGIVRADIKSLAKNIGYIMGAGDEIPHALQHAGWNVSLLDASSLAQADLGSYDAIVAGVCAYNVRTDLRANHSRLLEYMKNGGTYVVQYNGVASSPCTTRPEHVEHIGPFPLKIA